MDKMMREIDYWIWLTLMTGMGPIKARELLEIYKSPKVIYNLSEAELKNTPRLTMKNKQEMLDSEKRKKINAIDELMGKHNIKMMTILDPKYPDYLKQIYDPPVALYYQGDLDNINQFGIAVVGSRRTTYYGCHTAKKLAYDLGMRGVCVVSGLARGIDSIAHQGCLDAGGKTTAVLASGLDQIYPPENQKLFDDIIKSGGLAISEYPPGMPPLQHNFPARNRIISGIVSGVLVVEAAKRSGSLITAAYALEQGREVFAVPGNIDCVLSNGTNQLIKDGAKMVMTAEDILEEFQPDFTLGNAVNSMKSNFNILKGLSTLEIKIVKLIMDGIHQIDDIISNSKISAKEANNILFMLEMKGIITQFPGQNFELTT